MRHVAVVDVHLIVVAEPLEQVAASLAHLLGRQAQGRLAQPRGEGGVGVKRRGSLVDGAEQLAQDLRVHRRAHADEGDLVAALVVVAVLGRRGGRRDQIAVVGLLDEVLEEELRGAPQHGIDAPQVGRVGVEAVLLPEVEGQPGASRVRGAPRRILRGGREVPAVGQHVGAPPLRAVEVARRALARGDHPLDVVDQRQLQLAQIARTGDPVVHLHVDVGVVVAAPRRAAVDRVGPQSLEVGRQHPLARGGDHEVAAELHVEGCQRGIVGARAVAGQPHVGGHAGGRRAQVEGHAVEQAPVVGRVGPALLVEVARERLVEQLPDALGKVPGSAAGQAVEVVGGRRYVDHRLVGTLHREHPVGCRDLAAARAHCRLGAEADALRALAAARKLPAHHQAVARRFGLGARGARERHAEREGAALRRAEADGHHVVGARDEAVALVGDAARLEAGPGRGVGDVQAAPVTGETHGVEREVEVEAPQHLVAAVGRLGRAAAAAHEVAVHHPLRLEVAPRQQQLADAGQVVERLGVGRGLLGAAPAGDVVEHEVLVQDAAVGHGAQAAVAQGQSLLPVRSGAVVPQGQRLALRAVAGHAEQQRRGEQVDAFHRSNGYNFVKDTESRAQKQAVAWLCRDGVSWA